MVSKYLAGVAAAAMLAPACAFADDNQANADQTTVQTVADQTADSGGSDYHPHEWPHPPGGWAHPYVALDLGYHWPFAIDARSESPAPDGKPFEWQFKLNGDWDAFLRVGYRISPHWRAEFDGGLRESNVHSIHSTLPMGPDGLAVGRPGEPWGLCDHTNVPPPCAQINRPHVNWSYADNGMINLVYDLQPEKRWTPFIGAGIGIYHLQLNAHYYFSGVPGPITSQNPAVQQMQFGGSVLRPTQFAFQGIGGVSYRLRRKLNLDVTYRYIGAPWLRWETLNDTPRVNKPHGLQPGDFDGFAQDFSINVGLRYQL
jgi:opacity protein-like surface antigen